MEVLDLQEKDELAWDEYVQNTSLATPFHLVGWKRIMEKTYGYRAHYLVAKEAGRIEGVLPLFEVNSWILGDYVTSLCGGICTENAAVAQTLIEHAKAITLKAGAKSLIFQDSRQKWDSGLATPKSLRISFEFAPEFGDTLASTGPASALEHSHWFEEQGSG